MTHLSLSENAQIRYDVIKQFFIVLYYRSVIEIVEYMRLSGTNGLAILMGDFNTEPSSISMRHVLENNRINVSLVLIDRYLNGKVAIDHMSISLPLTDSWSTTNKDEITGATFSTLDAELSKRVKP